jgi:hypothetical protein
METSITSSTELCGTTEMAPIRNDTGNDFGNVNDTVAQSSTGTFVIRMFVNPFTIYGIRIAPGHYQTKLPPSLLIQNQAPVTNQENFADNYQLQEWIHIWKRIKNIQYKHPGYRAPISMLILLITHILIVICFVVMPLLYCFMVILLNVYCYVKHSEGNRFIMLYWRTIFAITVSANIVVHFAIADTFQRDEFHWQSDELNWQLRLLIIVGITMTPIGSINLCIPIVNAYCRYLAQHDEELRKIYDDILVINNEVSYFTLRPKVGFHQSNIAVDVYTGKQESGIHQLSSTTTITTTIDVQKSPNCSNDKINDPLLL